MDKKRRVFLKHCVLCSIAIVCIIITISFIVEGRFDNSTPYSHVYNNKSLSDTGMNHHSSNVDDVPESRWNMNYDDVKHHLHDKVQPSNRMYLGKYDGNYVIIDENISQIDHDKRAKVKEVILNQRQIRRYDIEHFNFTALLFHNRLSNSLKNIMCSRH